MSEISIAEFLMLSAEQLVDIREIDVSRKPNKSSRIDEFKNTIGYSSCYKVGDVILKPRYKREKTLDKRVCDIMENILKNK
jgi:hypothetical protein